LFEALTGKAAYLSETVSDTVAAILDREPDWHALPEPTPASLRRLLRRCLNKDRSERLQHIGDARVEITEALAEPALAVALTKGQRRIAGRKQPILWSLTFLVLVVLIAFWNPWRTREPSDAAQTLPQRALRFALSLPEGFALPQDTYGYAISPDGQKVVLVASRGTDSRLYLRTLDQMSFEAIPGTEGARFPFFSPDGEWMGFTTEDNIMKISLRGGTPQVLCEDCMPTSAAPDWGVDDSIFFGTRTGLWRISASGGKPELLAAPESTQEQATLFLWPELLPNRETVLFTISGGGRTSIALLSLETGEWRTLLERGSQPHYMPTGHMAYAKDGQLMVVPLDLKTLETLGEPTPLLETLAVGIFSKNFDASENGTLVYVPRRESKLVWRDRQGNSQLVPAPARGDYREPSISPDGERVAVMIVEGAARDIWVYELERGTLTRLTFGKDEWFTLWTPDGKNIVFTSGRAGQYNIYMKPADGSGDAERLTVHEHQQKASSWSPDGRVLLLNVVDPDSGGDIYQLSLDDDRTLTPFLKTPFFELNPKFSPDGRWVAYGSTESGRWEVYVRAYPSGEKHLVSVEGGRQPFWHPNGRELFFTSGSSLKAVSFSDRPSLHVGAPRTLFELSSVPGLNNENIDVSANGERFLVAEKEEIRQLNVVLNWFEELKRLVPTN
jgi:Tol biopolymer transport system component